MSALQTISPNGTAYGGSAHQPTNVGFGGQYGYYTDESGLILLGARYYDPGTHRFLNRDPIDYKGGSNLYAYCDGNPVNEIDPAGTDGSGWGIFSWLLKRSSGGSHASMDEMHAADNNGAMAALDGGSYDKAYTSTLNASYSRQAKSKATVANVANWAMMADGSGELVSGARLIWEVGAGIAARRTMTAVAARTGADVVIGAEERKGISTVLRRINRNDAHPYSQDGTVFNNRPVTGRTTPELPVKPGGYYHEYTVPTPGAVNRGARRIVTGNGNEIYYTPDHYNTFVQLR